MERLWREAGMQVPRKQCKCRRTSPCGGSENSCIQKRPLHPNDVWSYDFVEDRTEKGRKIRMLVVIEVLQYLFAVRGSPEHIRSDNGPGFVAQAVTRWLYHAGVNTLFIA